MDPRLNEQPTFGGLANLSSEKLQELQNTLTSILASPAAEGVYAQIIDGKLTCQPSMNHPGYRHDATANSDQLNPSHSAIQLYQNVRTSLQLQLLKVDMNVYLSLVIVCADINGDIAGPAIPECPAGKPRA